MVCAHPTEHNLGKFDEHSWNRAGVGVRAKLYRLGENCTRDKNEDRCSGETKGRLSCVFDIACLNEQPSNKLRLHTLCHGGKLQGSSRGITHEQFHGYVRVGTLRGSLGIRLRIPGLWRVDPHDPPHLSPCIRLPLSGPT